MTLMMTEVDESKGLSEEGGTGVELDLADPETLAWEKELIKTTFKIDEELQSEPNGIRIFLNSGRSFNDISSEAIFFDGAKMVGGYLLMFVYTAFMLGRINLVEHRVYLTAAGIFSVAMGLVIAYGLSLALGFPYTPIHAILPFLCLGIGIDDMFVIVQCWYNLQADGEIDLKEKRKNLAKKLGRTMMHAGVAITVTSVTDVFAFGIGAVTVREAEEPAIGKFATSFTQPLNSLSLLTYCTVQP